MRIVMLIAALSALEGAAQACDLHAKDAAGAGRGCARAWMDRNLAMNDLLTIGTHNSYHVRTPEQVMALIRAVSPEGWQGLDYSHGPLREQLEDGARALELDLVYDPEGGRFAHPAGARIAALPVSADYVSVMSKPGFKVLHIQDVDYTSNCLTFVQCLTIIRDWSRGHPDHAPILITMNTNDAKSRAPGGVDELPFDEGAYRALDAEIRSVFAARDLITPDDVQGHYATLREAVREQGWPRLGWARGRVLFALDEEAPHIKAYLGKQGTLRGRVLFLNVPEDSPFSAYITLNEAADVARITADVKAGLIVRTRADADTVEARSNDTRRRDAALVSGAQYVSTDYMRPDQRLSVYQARLPAGAIAVCNPQRRPKRCGGIPIEP